MNLGLKEREEISEQTSVNGNQTLVKVKEIGRAHV